MPVMRLASGSSDPTERIPITGTSVAARAASDHVAAAPPRSVTKSRRRMANIAFLLQVAPPSVTPRGQRPPVCGTLSLPRAGRRVLGTHLYRSELNSAPPVLSLVSAGTIAHNATARD